MPTGIQKNSPASTTDDAPTTPAASTTKKKQIKVKKVSAPLNSNARVIISIENNTSGTARNTKLGKNTIAGKKEKLDDDTLTTPTACTKTIKKKLEKPSVKVEKKEEVSVKAEVEKNAAVARKATEVSLRHHGPLSSATRHP